MSVPCPMCDGRTTIEVVKEYNRLLKIRMLEDIISGSHSNRG